MKVGAERTHCDCNNRKTEIQSVTHSRCKWQPHFILIRCGPTRPSLENLHLQKLSA